MSDDSSSQPPDLPGRDPPEGPQRNRLAAELADRYSINWFEELEARVGGR